MLQERKGKKLKITPVARHQHECEPASLMLLIMVIYEAICLPPFWKVQSDDRITIECYGPGGREDGCLFVCCLVLFCLGLSM